ncbi:MAG: nucleotidyltransferase family protein [Dehalococcoidia bacterium]
MPLPDALLLDLAARRAVEGRHASPAVVDQAIDHRMAGLLWSRIEAGAVTVEDADRARLLRIDLANRQHHRVLRSALAEVQRRAAEAGLEVASFKGVTAAARWYARPSERPASDLDVWLNPDQRAEGARLVEALAPEFEVPRKKRAALEASRLPVLEVPITTDLGTVAVDVHFDLLRLGVTPRDPRALWQGVHPIAIEDGPEALVLAPEAALLQLLLHTNRDRFRYLIGYADIARMLIPEDEQEAVDWPAFWRMTRREGAEVPVHETLRTVLVTLGLDPPPGLPGAPRGWRPALWRRLWGPSQRLLGTGSPGGDRRRLRFLPLLVRGATPEAAAAWVRGSV